MPIDTDNPYNHAGLYRGEDAAYRCGVITEVWMEEIAAMLRSIEKKMIAMEKAIAELKEVVK